MTNTVTTRRERFLFYKRRKQRRRERVRQRRKRGKPESMKGGTNQRITTGVGFVPHKSYPHVVKWRVTVIPAPFVLYKKSGGSDDPPSWKIQPLSYYDFLRIKQHARSTGVVERRTKAWPRLRKLPLLRPHD